MKKFLFSLLSIVLLSIHFSFILQTVDVEKIRKNPTSTYSLFKTYQKSLEKILPPITPPELYIIFCSIAAYSMAPYGSNEIKDLMNLEALLESPRLHCSNYGFLMMELAKAGYPQIENYVKVHSVAWNHGPFGAHGTNFIHRSYDDGIFLDPTCGLVALASYNEVAMGKKIPEEKIFNFGFRNDIAVFRDLVKHALLNGQCRPSHLYLYFNSTINHAEYFKNCFTDYSMLPTPVSQSL